MVTVWYYSATFTAGSGTADIGGLPFTTSNVSERYSVFFSQHNTAVDGNSHGGYFTNGATSARFTDANSTSVANFVAGSGKNVMFAGSYTV